MSAMLWANNCDEMASSLKLLLVFLKKNLSDQSVVPDHRQPINPIEKPSRHARARKKSDRVPFSSRNSGGYVSWLL